MNSHRDSSTLPPGDRADTPAEFPHHPGALNELIDEAEDLCAEFAIEIRREAHPTRRPQRIPKEVGE